MDFNQLIIIFIFLLLPGIVATVISDKIVVHSKWTAFKFGIYSLLFGVISYSSLQFLFFIKDIILFFISSNIHWSHLKIWGAFTSDKPVVPWSEVFLALIASIPVAFIIAFMINYKVFNKIGQRLNISQKYGDENLFSYYLNAKEIDWIYIRDIKENLTYQGRVRQYSENQHIQEIVLSDVTVYRYQDSAELYSVPTIYLAKPIGYFIIEAIPDEYFGG